MPKDNNEQQQHQQQRSNAADVPPNSLLVLANNKNNNRARNKLQELASTNNLNSKDAIPGSFLVCFSAGSVSESELEQKAAEFARQSGGTVGRILKIVHGFSISGVRNLDCIVCWTVMTLKALNR